MENIEAAMKRIPPHSIEAEQAVLGAMLMNKDAVMVASEIITGEDFFQTAYGIIFDSVVDLFKAGKPADLITLQEKLKEKNVPPEISSMEFVKDLLEGTQTSANVKYYAEIVRDKSILRRLIRINEDIANTCYLENQPLDEILEKTQKEVFELVVVRSAEIGSGTDCCQTFHGQDGVCAEHCPARGIPPESCGCHFQS